jgi:hypothetical protein
MQTPEKLSEWNSDDIAILRQFLESRTGSRLVAALAESAPLLLDGGHANKTLVRNGELRGYQSALRELLSLANPPPEPTKEITEYPSLVDDDAWQDGQKIETPKQ